MRKIQTQKDILWKVSFHPIPQFLIIDLEVNFKNLYECIFYTHTTTCVYKGWLKSDFGAPGVILI